MSQLDLFAPAIGTWRKGQPDTARKAAIAQWPRTGTQKANVLAALYEAGEHGATAHELAAKARIARPHVADTRRADLAKAGWCEATNRTRPTDLNAQATVHRITPAGIEAYRRMREAS